MIQNDSLTLIAPVLKLNVSSIPCNCDTCEFSTVLVKVSLLFSECAMVIICPTDCHRMKCKSSASGKAKKHSRVWLTEDQISITLVTPMNLLIFILYTVKGKESMLFSNLIQFVANRTFTEFQSIRMTRTQNH